MGTEVHGNGHKAWCLLIWTIMQKIWDGAGNRALVFKSLGECLITRPFFPPQVSIVSYY